MTGDPLLLPNLGGEEDGWRRTLREPRVAAAARLWRLLFSNRARLASGYFPEPTADEDWPAELSPGRTTAAFDWLTDVNGCIPWLSNAEVRRDPACRGLPIWGAPAEIVERVHDKAFAQRAARELDLIPRSLPATPVVFEPADLASGPDAALRIERELRAWPDWARASFTLKPRFGSSGRGRFDAPAGAVDTPGLRKALPRLAARGGAILEPWLERTADLSAQLLVTGNADIVLLGTLEQLSSQRGSYLGHRGEVDSRGRVFSGHRDDEELRGAAAQIARAAAAEGYRGPCGVDGLVFQRAHGQWPHGDSGLERVLRPVVELNARFTMGIVILGLVRRALEVVADLSGIRPGDRHAFGFRIDSPHRGWREARALAGDGAVLVPLWCEGDSVRPALLFADGQTDLDRALAAR